jgi:hypothetical protein
MAYYRAACNFFDWLEQHGIGEPFHVAAYLKALTVSDPSNRSARKRRASDATKKQHLAAIRLPLQGFDAPDDCIITDTQIS